MGPEGGGGGWGLGAGVPGPGGRGGGWGWGTGAGAGGWDGGLGGKNFSAARHIRVYTKHVHVLQLLHELFHLLLAVRAEAACATAVQAAMPAAPGGASCCQAGRRAAAAGVPRCCQSKQLGAGWGLRVWRAGAWGWGPGAGWLTGGGLEARAWGLARSGGCRAGGWAGAGGRGPGAGPPGFSSAAFAKHVSTALNKGLGISHIRWQNLAGVSRDRAKRL